MLRYFPNPGTALGPPTVPLTACRRPVAAEEARRPQARSTRASARSCASATMQAGGAAESPAAQQQQTQQARKVGMRTCRRCKQQFDPAANGEQSCRYHSALWTGGEVSKAIGFCRQSDAPEHQLRAVIGRTGLLRFWDCCGAEAEDAPGCCTARHVTYDEPDD